MRVLRIIGASEVPGEESCMKRSRYTKEQIGGVLKESEAGVETPQLCRKHGISQQTFYRWKAKYGGLEVSEAQRLRQLEEENRSSHLIY
jgi:putative transposase